MLSITRLLSSYDPVAGSIAGAAPIVRRLADLRGCFVDSAAYDSALAIGNPVVYHVSSVETARGDGDLHYGIGCVMPGKVGAEYYLTKGHLHARRDAAEIYFGLTGSGVMLLEDESSGQSCTIPLQPKQAVYVPGHTAHRTINTGAVPLTYLGIYPANAGHDYAAIAQNNFRKIVIAENGVPVVRDRPVRGS